MAEKIEPEKPSKRLKVEQNLDADDPLDDSDVDNSDSDSDDDETAALMAELQKIKREKAAEEREKVKFNRITMLCIPRYIVFIVFKKH